MKIQKAFCQTIKVPLTQPLAHSRRSFRTSESLFFLVEIDKVSGVGECAPRSYVTGETIESAILIFNSLLKNRLVNFSFETLEEVEEYLDSLIADNNALKAGIEIAIMDAVGKLMGKPVYKQLFSKSARGVFRINGGAPFFASKRKTLAWVKRFYNRGVRIFKIKVGKDIKEDLFRLHYLREEFPDIQLRVDANGAWGLRQAIKSLSKMEQYKIYLVEEPLASRDPRKLRKLREKISIPIMADESLVTLADALALIELRACSWFNIRLSKNGGFLKSKKILELGKQAGIKIQIGSHFGESGVLEAARRHFAFGAPGINSFEGGTIMLFKEQVTREHLGFDDDLLANIDSINRPGLGVSLKEKYLKNFN